MGTIVAISSECFKNPKPYFAELMELHAQRKIIIASSKKMRNNYSQIYDENDDYMRHLKMLINSSRTQGLHIELGENIPSFVYGSFPKDIDENIGTALITHEEATNAEEWASAIYDPKNINYIVRHNLKHIKDGPKRIAAKEPCYYLEDHLLSKVRWTTRITIIDPYAIIREGNLNATLRFLDFIQRENINLKQFRMVLGTHYTENVTETNEDGDKTKLKKEFRGGEARKIYREIFKEKILQHELFENTEKIQIGWSKGNSKRFLSFGCDSKEITLPFDKGVSVHFQVNKKDQLSHEIDLAEQFDQLTSEKTVDFEYEDMI